MIKHNLLYVFSLLTCTGKTPLFWIYCTCSHGPGFYWNLQLCTQQYGPLFFHQGVTIDYHYSQSGHEREPFHSLWISNKIIINDAEFNTHFTLDTISFFIDLICKTILIFTGFSFTSFQSSMHDEMCHPSQLVMWPIAVQIIIVGGAQLSVSKHVRQLAGSI